MDQTAVIKLASTTCERASAFRVRYEVFTRELQDFRYVDHSKGEFLDEDDGDQSQVLIAIVGDQVVGTIRHTILRQWNFIAAEKFRFDILARTVDTDEAYLKNHLARIDRCAILAGWRGKGLVSKLVRAAEDISILNGVFIHVGIPGAANRQSREAFARLGFIDYPVVDTYKGYTCQCIYKILTPQTGIGDPKG